VQLRDEYAIRAEISVPRNKLFVETGSGGEQRSEYRYSESMTNTVARDHWDSVWRTKRPEEVSWFQERAGLSLELIAEYMPDRTAAIIDAGGGASRLVDALLAEGYTDVSVLDLSAPALDVAKARLGASAARVHWFGADALEHRPVRPYRVWHDRAMFHFIRSDDDTARYRATLERSVAPRGIVIIATFALDGPQRCSNLDVRRCGADEMAAALGSSFSLVEQRDEVHRTPWGAEQRFAWFVLRRG